MRYACGINGAETFNAAVDLACQAEEAGWDGFFLPDGISIGTYPLFDPWVVMGAIAARTKRIRFGTMITPVSRRRPWKLARECVTVDQPSAGRLILAVGMGAAADDGGFTKVGEATDLKVRAKRVDEGLEILNGLWKGKPYSFSGEHYRVDNMVMVPRPVHKPRIPIGSLVCGTSRNPCAAPWLGTASFRRNSGTGIRFRPTISARSATMSRHTVKARALSKSSAAVLPEARNPSALRKLSARSSMPAPRGGSSLTHHWNASG